MNNISKEREGITKGCGLQSFEKEGEQGWSTSQGSEHLPGRKEGLSHPTGTLDGTHPSPAPPHHPDEEGTTKAKGWKQNQAPLEQSKKPAQSSSRESKVPIQVRGYHNQGNFQDSLT